MTICTQPCHIRCAPDLVEAWIPYEGDYCNGFDELWSLVVLGKPARCMPDPSRPFTAADIGACPASPPLVWTPLDRATFRRDPEGAVRRAMREGAEERSLCEAMPDHEWARALQIEELRTFEALIRRAWAGQMEGRPIIWPSEQTSIAVNVPTPSANIDRLMRDLRASVESITEAVDEGHAEQVAAVRKPSQRRGFCHSNGSAAVAHHNARVRQQHKQSRGGRR